MSSPAELIIIAVEGDCDRALMEESLLSGCERGIRLYERESRLINELKRVVGLRTSSTYYKCRSTLVFLYQYSQLGLDADLPSILKYLAGRSNIVRIGKVLVHRDCDTVNDCSLGVTDSCSRRMLNFVDKVNQALKSVQQLGIKCSYQRCGVECNGSILIHYVKCKYELEIKNKIIKTIKTIEVILVSPRPSTEGMLGVGNVLGSKYDACKSAAQHHREVHGCLSGLLQR